jgi:amino acid adenylation domain-containing protein
MSKRLLQHWVTEQADQRPQAPALVMSGETLTYAGLEALTNQIARGLRALGCQMGDRVALLMPKSITAIAAIVGTLKADAIYVPLDTSSPAPRLQHMLAASEPHCIVVTRPAAPLLREIRRDARFAGIPIVWLDTAEPDETFALHVTRADIVGLATDALSSGNAPEAPAYILFTSGSTGTPKGVVITHANVTCFIDWAVPYFGLGPSDRVSGHPPLHFDLSVFDIFGAFAAGAALYPVPAELNLMANKLAEFIRAARLTQWFSVPSLLGYLAKFDAVRAGDFPDLRRLLWCGEVLPTPVLIHWMTRLPHVRFTNLYGPTEATIASSYYSVPARPADDKAAVPIGVPCEGERLLVLDEHLGPVAAGEIGDLYIAGAGLSPGYWRDADKTREVFRVRPGSTERLYRTGDLARVDADGLLYFVGRADSQIKSRGYRIELGEIEAALNALPQLKECAVVAYLTGGFEGATICCAYVPEPGGDTSASSLRKQLAGALPAYMLPSRWRAFEILPKNANGKIDRRQLREEFERDTGDQGGA